MGIRIDGLTEKERMLQAEKERNRNTYRIVHEGLDGPEGGGVDGGLRGLPVHPAQQLQQAVQPILL